MSSILKALRRLEEERARKSSVAPEIAASLLRHGARRRPTSTWVWPTVVIAVAAMAAALLWSWRPASVEKQTLMSVASPATISSTATTERSGVVIIEEVIDQRRPVLLPPTPPVVSVPAPLPTSPPPPVVKSGGSVPVTADKPATAFIEERRSPVVSAIVWQVDSSARMAVVDGLPVMSGESVGTARIQEILRDRILFAEAGKLFTVYVDPQ